jgi:hypothetical protein
MDKDIATIIGAVISTIGAITGFLIGFLQFNKTKRDELKKRYWEEQILIYKETCDVIGAIASAEKIAEVETERKRFRQLFWGTMCLVENKEVAKAMVDYGNQLDLWESGEKKSPLLKDLAVTIAHKCRESLDETWNPANKKRGLFNFKNWNIFTISKPS